MSNIILLVLCFTAGILLRRGRVMPDNAPAVLNTFIIYISVPALALLYIHDLTFSGDTVLVVLMAWLYFALAAVFFLAVSRYFKFSRGTTGALILTGGLGNTAFFGLPMIEAYWGHDGIATGILIDQTGSFMAISTVGIVVAGIYSNDKPSVSSIVINILKFPPFIAMMAAFMLLPVAYPDWLVAVLKRLGDTLAPLAMLSVGMQLRLGQVWGNCCSLIIGLTFKLLL
ncbi:MAG TPA: AEC family transporter, partial [Pseudomonadales bacterium]